MLLEYLLYLHVWNVPAQFDHGAPEVFPGDLVVSVDIKLSKKGFKFLMSKEFVDWDGRRQELGVVDDVVPVVVQLLNDCLQFLGPRVVVCLGKSFLELLYLNEAGVVGVDGLEDLPKGLDVLRP